MVWLRSGDYDDVQFYGNNLLDLRDNPVYVWHSEDRTYYEQNLESFVDEGFISVADRDFRLTAEHPAVNFATGVKAHPETDARCFERTDTSLDAGAFALIEKGQE